MLRPCIRCYTWDPLCAWCKDANPPKDEGQRVSPCPNCRPAFQAMHRAKAWARRWKRAAKSLRRTVDLQIREREHQDQLRVLVSLAKDWLSAEDAFLKTMSEANTATWYPGYGDGCWDAVEKARERFRAEVEKG